MRRILSLAALVLLCIAASQVNDVGGTRMKSFVVATGGDSTFTLDSFGLKSGRPTWSRVTKLGIRNTGTGVDSLALHLISGWTVMSYPQGVNDVFEIQLRLMDEIDRKSATHADEVFRYDNNGANPVLIQVWGI